MPELYPPYIFGTHDRGAEQLMVGQGKRGWVLVTEAIGSDPANHVGSNYTDLTNQGLGVIVRLNHGYGDAGTIPHSNRYDDFARRCGNFVQASAGCHIWILGNEMNLANERPGGPSGQVITPELYAACFRKCRVEIHGRPGHHEDQVVIAAVGPWNTQTKYPGNQRGDWVKYFADILTLLDGDVDGLALHTYTHGQEPHLVFDNATMAPPFDNRHWHFRAYRDFLAVVPPDLRNRPVYITETDQYGAWRNENTGWVRNAYKEIDDWNHGPENQPIQALVLFRWIVANSNDPQQVGWAIENKPGVQDDFRAAMNNEYRVILPHLRPDYRVAWLQVDAPGRMERGAVVQFPVKVRNEGRSSWSNTGDRAIRLGYRWLHGDGSSTEGQRTDLPRPVASGETVTLPQVVVQAPGSPGYDTLELDLVEGASSWFAESGSLPWPREVQIGPRYRVAWLEVDPPSQGVVAQQVTFPARLRNEGALTWPPDGDRPVVLTYKWLDADRNVVVADGLRTPIGRPVAPLEEISLDARLQFPAAPGLYILQMDMVHEFVVWFQWKGSPVYEVQVDVEPAAPDYAAEWPDYAGPERLAVGQVGSVYLQVRNVGAKPWPASGAEAIRLGYRWLDAQGQQVPVDDARTWPLPRTIESGFTATFRDVAFTAPPSPGSYRLVWDLVQAGVWLSTQGVAVREQAMQIVASQYGVAWQLLEPLPERMLPGEEQRASLRLVNTGTVTWTARGAQPVHLAYTWFTASGALAEPWDTFRIQLPEDIPPGAGVELVDVAFKTPSVRGEYLLRWDLVEEGQTWFFRAGAGPLEMAVEISERVLAVPWSAQASHNSEEANLAVDGDPGTRWDSKADQESGMWFQVDLGQTLVLDRVRVTSPGRGFPLGYRLLVSTDEREWHLIADRPRNWMNVDAAFAPCQARYVRLEQTGQADWPASWMINELTVSTTSLWIGAEASHFTSDGHQALDARLDTAWNTRNVKQKPAMWFKVDMGALHEIERVRLESPTSQQPRGYVVEVSGDGQTWQEVGRNDDNWAQAEAQFEARSARYIRVQTTNTSPYHPWGIAEFVVWRSSPTWLVGRTG